MGRCPGGVPTLAGWVGGSLAMSGVLWSSTQPPKPPAFSNTTVLPATWHWGKMSRVMVGQMRWPVSGSTYPTKPNSLPVKPRQYSRVLAESASMFGVLRQARKAVNSSSGQPSQPAGSVGATNGLITVRRSRFSPSAEAIRPSRARAAASNGADAPGTAMSRPNAPCLRGERIGRQAAPVTP